MVVQPKQATALLDMFSTQIESIAADNSSGHSPALRSSPLTEEIRFSSLRVTKKSV